MARFFFHLHDGRDLPDLEGQEMTDLKTAQAYAAEIVFRQLREDTESKLPPQAWTLNVTDGRQQVLFTLKFEAATS